MNRSQPGRAGVVPGLADTLKLGKRENHAMLRKTVTATVFLTVLAVVALSAGTAQATTYTFTPTAAATYDWTNAANWDANGVPADANDAVVTFFSNTTTALGQPTIAINTDPATLT